MNKKFYFSEILALLLVLSLTSNCKGQVEQNEATQVRETTSSIESPPTGTPFEDGLIFYVKGKKMLCAPKSDAQITWYRAKEICEEYGPEWRIPTIQELDVLYEQQEQLGDNFGINNFYWSSNVNGEDVTAMSFENGKTGSGPWKDLNYFGGSFYLRAVRDL